MKIRQEINIIDKIYTDAGDCNEIVYLNTESYSGSATYYFEIVATVVSGTLTVALERAGTATQDTTISVTETSFTLKRSTSFTPPAGATAYNINLSGGTTPQVKSARIIIIHDDTVVMESETQIEIGNNETGKTNTAAAALTNPKYWNYNSSKWPIDPNRPTDLPMEFLAEVTWKKVNRADPLPVVRAVGAVDSGAAVAITPGVPTGTTTNDIMVLITESSTADTIVSTGWTAAVNSPQGDATDLTRLTVLWKRAGASETAPSVTGSSNHIVGRIISISGCVTSGDPFDITQGSVDTASDTTGSITGATTTVANTMVIAACCTGNDGNSTAQFTGWTNADLANLTERMDNCINSGAGGGIGMATGEKVTAGAYGATTVTYANASRKGMWSGALKPAAATDTVTITLQEDNGSFGGWANIATIVNADTTDNTITRTRSATFTPTATGRNYRIAGLTSHSGTTYDIYNAKLIVRHKYYNAAPGAATNCMDSDQNYVYWVRTSGVYRHAKGDTWITLTATTGSDGSGVGICNDETYVYVSSSTGNLYRILKSSWTVVDTMTGLTSTYAITHNSSHIYIISTASPGVVRKIRKSDFTEESSMSLPVGANSILRCTIDKDYLYSASQTTPTNVYRLLLSDFTTVDTLPLNTGANTGSRILNDDTYIYVANDVNPGIITRILKSNFSTMNDLTLPAGANRPFTFVQNSYYVIVGTYTDPAILVKINKSSWTLTYLKTYSSAALEKNMYDGTIDDNYLYMGSLITNCVLKIPITLSKLQTEYLLGNTLLPTGTALQKFLTKWDSEEWWGVSNLYTHVVDSASGTSSVVELDTEAGTQIVGSVVTSPSNRGASSILTMPANINLDVKATTNGNNIYSSKIIADIIAFKRESLMKNQAVNRANTY